MDWNIIQEFLRPELLIIVAVVYCLGLFIKQIPSVPDWTIPLILLGFAIIITVVWIGVMLNEGFIATTIVGGIVYGIIACAIAVFGNQVIKQIKKQE